MKYPKLRIAWSVFFGIVCLLLIGLWVRSYVTDTHKVLRNPSPAQSGYMLSSTQGKFTVSKLVLLNTLGGGVGVRAVPPAQVANTIRIAGFEWNRSASAVTIPYWFPVLSCALGAALSWLRRFSLRTLLIAMTVVAVLLGLIVYAGS